MALSPGTRLGVYEVAAKIGEGGMGEVYRARDTKLDRDVALKVLPELFTADPDRLARFEREAKVLASLNHTNIGHIYGLEETGDARALVLELVEGPTLAGRIAQGPIPIEEALPIAAQIAEALEVAHEQGVIHRDLKPANIKVREDGTVKVLDFGLAKAMAPTAPDPSLSLSPTISLTAAATQMGMVIGTAAYMAPEQAKGKPVDARADVWAFGAVLYEMLTGQRPFVGDDVSDTLALVLKFEPEWDRLPADVPPRIRRLIQTCLQKSPKQRLHAVADVRLAMEGVFETVAPAEPAPTSVSERPVPVWQRPAVLVATGLLLAALTALGAWTLRPEPPREVTRFTFDLPEGQLLRTRSRAVLAVSRDGRQFAYNTTDGLYLRGMDALAPRLVPETEETIGLPTFSPDGQSVLFLRPPELQRLSLGGGAPVVIATVQDLAISAHWADDDTVYYADDIYDGGIYRVPATGGTPELVVPAGEGELLDTPFLLPNGDTLLFSAQPSDAGGWDDADIVAQSLSAGGRTVVLSGGSDPRYVPSGHLVYAFEDGLFAVAFDPDRLTLSGGTVSMVQGVGRASISASANYDVSADGTLFYLTGNVAASSRLVWVDRSGQVEPIETIPANQYFTPRLSPDGEWVLVVAEGDLRAYEIASGRESRLTADGRVENYAGWTPSGTEVSYTARRGGADNIWMQPVDGSGPERQLTTFEGRMHFDSWAPDGSTIAAHHHAIDGGNHQLMLSSTEAEVQPDRWLEREFTDSNAVFSPDGRYVAQISDQSGLREIYIRPYPGPGGQTTVSVGGGEEPQWAANGELFYRRPGDYAMMAVEVRTEPTLEVGTPRVLFNGTNSPGGSPRARYAVTADGQRFLMSADLAAASQADEAAGPQIQVVLNWVEELKARVPVP